MQNRKNRRRTQLKRRRKIRRKRNTIKGICGGE
jgi:hypothetical protein